MILFREIYKIDFRKNFFLLFLCTFAVCQQIWFWASFSLIKQFRMLPRSVLEMRIMLKADKMNTKNLLDYQFYQIRMTYLIRTKFWPKSKNKAFANGLWSTGIVGSKFLETRPIEYEYKIFHENFFLSLAFCPLQERAEKIKATQKRLETL